MSDDSDIAAVEASGVHDICIVQIEKPEIALEFVIQDQFKLGDKFKDALTINYSPPPKYPILKKPNGDTAGSATKDDSVYAKPIKFSIVKGIGAKNLGLLNMAILKKGGSGLMCKKITVSALVRTPEGKYEASYTLVMEKNVVLSKEAPFFTVADPNFVVYYDIAIETAKLVESGHVKGTLTALNLVCSQPLTQFIGGHVLSGDDFGSNNKK